MNADDECIHGLGTVAACVICNGRAEQEHRARLAADGAEFTARFESVCPACTTTCEIGDRIVHVAGGFYVHIGCAL